MKTLNTVTINPTWALWLKMLFYLEYLCFYKNTKNKIYLDIKNHTETSVKIKTAVMEL